MKNINKYNYLISRVILTLSFLLIFFILALCTNTFYWSDDYAFLLDLNKNGVIKHCVSWYFEWDGRTLTLGGFLQALGLLYLPVEFLTFCWSICFITSGALVFYIIKEELNLNKQEIKNKYLVITSLIITFWLGCYFILSEVVYWAVGGYYSLTLLFGAIWILFYLKTSNVESSLFKKYCFILFSFIVGASTQNLSIGLIVLVLITIFTDILEHKKVKMGFNLSVLIALILGLMFISLAPGNWLRIQTIKNELTSELTLGIIFRNSLKILYHYFSRAIFLVPLSLLCGISIVFSNYSINKIDFFNISSLHRLKIDFCYLLKKTKWFLVALSTIIPFILFPELVTYRTTIYFLYFLFIYVVLFSIKMTKKIFIIDDSKRLNFYGIIGYAFFLLIIISNAYFAYSNFSKGLILKQAIVEREKKLKDVSKESVELKIIDSALIPICYQFVDFSKEYPKGKEGTITYQEEYYRKKITIIK